MDKEKVWGIDRVLQRFCGPEQPTLPVSGKTLKAWRREDPATALQRLITKAGSQAKLAAMLGVAQRTVSVWLASDIPLDQRPAAAPRNEVDRVVIGAGGQPKVAADLGVTQQCVAHWCKQGYAPPSRAQEMEHLYGVPRTSLINPKLLNALGAGGEL